jgi:hypothetical protein
MSNYPPSSAVPASGVAANWSLSPATGPNISVAGTLRLQPPQYSPSQLTNNPANPYGPLFPSTTTGLSPLGRFRGLGYGYYNILGSPASFNVPKNLTYKVVMIGGGGGGGACLNLPAVPAPSGAVGGGGGGAGGAVSIFSALQTATTVTCQIGAGGAPAGDGQYTVCQTGYAWGGGAGGSTQGYTLQGGNPGGCGGGASGKFGNSTPYPGGSGSQGGNGGVSTLGPGGFYGGSGGGAAGQVFIGGAYSQGQQGADGGGGGGNGNFTIYMNSQLSMYLSGGGGGGGGGPSNVNGTGGGGGSGHGGDITPQAVGTGYSATFGPLFGAAGNPPAYAATGPNQYAYGGGGGGAVFRKAYQTVPAPGAIAGGFGAPGCVIVYYP